jgi:hypothetical protein
LIQRLVDLITCHMLQISVFEKDFFELLKFVKMKLFAFIILFTLANVNAEFVNELKKSSIKFNIGTERVDGES